MEFCTEKLEKVMDLSIREAEISDAEALSEYLIKVGGETDNLSFGRDTFRMSIKKEERFINKFKSSPQSLMLLALDGEMIIANASVEQSRVERYAHRAELSITVLRDYWGQGVGSALMRKLIEASKAVGLDSLFLDVRSDNTRAVALYEKFGFKKIGTYENYFKIDGKYYSADLMNLFL